ncbi:MAG: Mth938-like domain-containing protein [Betaproteobacteria bacterium]
MKFHLARVEGRNSFSGYGNDYVEIGGTRYAQSVIVLADRIIDWEAARFEDLTTAEFAAIAKLEVDVVVLGTGPRLRFPHPSKTAPLLRAGIGLEVMDTRAACRTYNVLLAEDRRVGAALLMGSAGSEPA